MMSENSGHRRQTPTQVSRPRHVTWYKDKLLEEAQGAVRVGVDMTTTAEARWSTGRCSEARRAWVVRPHEATILYPAAAP